jgi:DNA protecting protein DprA
VADENLKYRIGITLIKGIGNSLAKNLIAYLGSEEAVFREKQATLAKIPGIGEVLSREIVNQNVLERAEEEINFIEKNKIQPLYFTEKNYPFRLKECPDAPVIIYTKVNCNLNSEKIVAVVGTRNATDEGKENCVKMITSLAADFPEIIIVSGLAYGIDICAHKAALDCGLPTIGVIGHGLDRIYPQANRATAVKMLKNGGLITEYMSGTNPDRSNFVQRNRIIAGMSDAVVVVESAESGGALITAILANDYNRDVFAFPGRVDDTWSGGCNKLIKNNQAALVENADDIIRAMNWEKSTSKTEPVQPLLFIDLNDDEQTIVGLLRSNSEGLQINEIAIQTGKPVSKISSLLLQMEFKNILRCYPGNVYKIQK